jgi:hypothetical protein
LSIPPNREKPFSWSTARPKPLSFAHNSAKASCYFVRLVVIH